MKKMLLFLLLLFLLLSLIACNTNPPQNNANQTLNNSEPTKDCVTDSDCMKSGCSGQLCIPKSQKQGSFTICDFKPEYECYSNQNCICKNSKCSWSDAESVNSCITEKSKITA